MISELQRKVPWRKRPLFLAVQVMFIATISTARAEEPFRLNPEQVKKHFSELTMVSPGPSQRYLRWSQADLRMTFLTPDKSQLARDASIGIKLVTNLFSDAIPIEQTKGVLVGSQQADTAKQADLLFIVAPTKPEIDALMPDLETLGQGLEWLDDPSAFGPGCGVMIGYAADSMTIKKAILTIEGRTLLGANADTTDRKLISGYAFNCTNQQLATALGLVKDWGHHVSAPSHSTFVSSHNAPYYDWAALQILYRKEFGAPISATAVEQSLAANAACLAQNNMVCATN